MTDYPHLAPEVARVADLPDAERIAFSGNDRWISYPCAERLLAQMQELVTCPRTIRPQSLLITGNPANGKSTILQEFLRRYRVTVSDRGVAMRPVVRMEIPGSGKPRRVWSALLTALAVSHSERDSADVLFSRAMNHLRLCETRAIIIDEFHNISEARGAASSILASFKELSNELKLSLIAAGIGSKSRSLLGTEFQTESRFDFVELEPWTDDETYRRFLAVYERLLPLRKPSKLSAKTFAMQIFQFCGSEIGFTVKLLRDATRAAIVTGQECITLDLIEKTTAKEKRERRDAAVGVR